MLKGIKIFDIGMVKTNLWNMRTIYFSTLAGIPDCLIGEVEYPL